MSASRYARSRTASAAIAAVLYLTLLTPARAFPALLLMQRLDAWTLTGVKPRPSLLWTRSNGAPPARGSGRRHAPSRSPPTRELLHGGGQVQPQAVSAMQRSAATTFGEPWGRGARHIGGVTPPLLANFESERQG